MQNLEFTYNYDLKLINETHIEIKNNKEIIDYSNKISLIELITKFNKLYLMFKKKYKKIKKINLSQRVELVDFKEKGAIKSLVLNLYGINPGIFNKDYATLYIHKSNSIIDSYITNDNPLFNNRKNIKLDCDVINGYFNLLDEYKILIDMYEEIKEKFIFENNKGTLIGNLNGNILDELSTFDFVFITYGVIDMNIIELSYKLGSLLFLLGSSAKIDGEMIGKKDELNKISNHILENLYIDKFKVINDYREKEKTLKI